MFAAPSSTTAIESLSSSPTSTTSPSSTQNDNKIILSSRSEFEGEQGYTIYVPANVRFRGVNMHLDLEIDEKALSVASSEISKPKRSVSRSSNKNTDLLHSPGDSYCKSPTKHSSTGKLSPSCSQMIEHVSETSIDVSRQFQNVSSTTVEQVEKQFPDHSSTVDSEFSSHSDDVPVTSTISASQEETEAVVDTTTTIALDDVIINPTQSSQTANTRRKSGDIDRKNLTDLCRNDVNIVDRCGTPSSNLSDCCLPSSSSECKTLINKEEKVMSQNSELNAKKSPEDDDNALVHDNQPCSSSNLTGSEQISSTASSDCSTLGKKRRIATPNFCGFVDDAKGQCKQRAILNYKYCIRHILLDPLAPYRQCQHRRKPKNKKGDFMQCTNAIRTDKPDVYCSTHLIMKGMMQPKAKKNAGVTGSMPNSQFAKSPSAVMASPAALSKTIDYFDESTTASVKSMTAAEGNSSFESGQVISFGGDLINNSRTGCESTSSWDQMSNMSGSVTPSRTNFSQQQLSNGQQSDYAQSQLSYFASDSAIAAQTPTLNQPLIAQANAAGNYAQSNVTAHNIVINHSIPVETAVEAPNFDVNNSSNNGRYFAQQTPRYNNELPPGTFTYSQNTHQTTLNDQSTSAMYEQRIRPQPSATSGEYNAKDRNSLYISHESHSSYNAPIHQSNVPSGSRQPMSRLSKQHPELAAKLLQPSYPVSQKAHLPTHCLPPPDSSTMMSPEKHNFLSHNINLPAFASPPLTKHQAPPDLVSRLSNPAFRHALYLRNNSADVTVYSPHPQLRQPLLQHGQVFSAANTQQGSRSAVGNDDQYRQMLRDGVAISQPKSFGSIHLRNSGLVPSIQFHGAQNSFATSQISSQQLAKLLSKPAYVQYQTRLLEAMSAQCVDFSSFMDAEPKPVKYRINSTIEDLGVNEETKIRRDYLNHYFLGATSSSTSENSHQRRATKSSISLRRKRQKVRISGAYRNVPLMNSMCKIIEYHDFDSTDLFPLGLEPSDDESSSDEGFPTFKSDWNCNFSDTDSDQYSKRIGLYLLKKRLRLESSRLVRSAKVSMPIIEAAKVFKNCVGAALRTRKMNRRRQLIIGVETPRYRICQFDRTTDKSKTKDSARCERYCLPMSNYCSHHVLYGVEQKLFTYCKRVCCGRPVLCADALLLNGMCRLHYDESVAPPKISDTSTTIDNTLITRSRRKNFDITNGVQRSDKNMNWSNADVAPQNVSKYFTDQVDQNNDDVVEDVSLASVAKDLGLNGNELTDMLEHLPVDDSLDGHEMEDGEGFFESVKSEEDVSGLALGHSWADVEQFLLSEGYHGA